MVFELLGASNETILAMAVTFCPPRCSPNVFLWVQVGRSRGKREQFRTWIGFEQFTNLRPVMPGRFVPQHKQWHLWIGGKQEFEMSCCRLGVHRFGLGHTLAPRLEIERAIA